MSAIRSRRRTRSTGAARVQRRPHRSAARTGTESAASVRAESCGPGAVNFMQEPGAREPDIAMDGRPRRTQRRGGLVVCQAAEIVQFDDLSQAGLHVLQSLEGLVERNDVEINRRRCRAQTFAQELAGARVE